jgi:hypothetical protein
MEKYDFSGHATFNLNDNQLELIIFPLENMFWFFHTLSLMIEINFF